MAESGGQRPSWSAASLASPEEVSQLLKAGMGQRMGFGVRPALLIVDAQNYEVGPASPHDLTDYPQACPTAAEAVPHIADLAQAFRAASLLVIYTQTVYRIDGADLGVKQLKRSVPFSEGWCFVGTTGAEISPLVAPQASDHVLQKSKQSAFHGTSLLDLLVLDRVDTIVITGGTTSNCVRATAIDAAAFNFRPIVVADAVFDRVELSHRVSLFDIERQLGDVVTSSDVLGHVASLSDPSANARGEQ